MSDKLPPLRLPLDEKTRGMVYDELFKQLWDAVQELQDSIIVPRKTAPDKLREGMLAYADGANWNPGSGAGIYQYRSGVWNKL